MTAAKIVRRSRTAGPDRSADRPTDRPTTGNVTKYKMTCGTMALNFRDTVQTVCSNEFNAKVIFTIFRLCTGVFEKKTYVLKNNNNK